MRACWVALISMAALSPAQAQTVVGGGEFIRLLEPARGLAVQARELADSEGSFERERRRHIEALQSEVVGFAGVKPEAVENARRAIGVLMAQAHPFLLKRMADRRFRTYIVPNGRRVTDVPALAHLKGKKDPDTGMKYDSGDGLAEDFALAIKEGDLLRGRHGPPRFAIFVHEWGHAVTSNLPPKFVGVGLPSSEELGEMSQAAIQTRGKSDLSGYAYKSKWEYIADATSAFFNVGLKENSYFKAVLGALAGGGFNGIGQWKRLGPEVLKEKQPALYDAFVKIYGPPRNLELSMSVEAGRHR